VEPLMAVLMHLGISSWSVAVVFVLHIPSTRWRSRDGRGGGDSEVPSFQRSTTAKSLDLLPGHHQRHSCSTSIRNRKDWIISYRGCRCLFAGTGRRMAAPSQHQPHHRDDTDDQNQNLGEIGEWPICEISMLLWSTHCGRVSRLLPTILDCLWAAVAAVSLWAAEMFAWSCSGMYSLCFIGFLFRTPEMDRMNRVDE
jgi:hypothetical protein